MGNVQSLQDAFAQVAPQVQFRRQLSLSGKQTYERNSRIAAVIIAIIIVIATLGAISDKRSSKAGKKQTSFGLDDCGSFCLVAIIFVAIIGVLFVNIISAINICTDAIYLELVEKK
jgi:hypothetical protein